MRKTLLSAVVLLVLAGCGTIHFDVPAGTRIKLLERDAPTSVRVERVIWYALWGNHPLSENHTAPVIEEYQLTEVKLHNEQSTLDSIINVFTAIFSFSRRTMIVEGNPAEEVKQ